MPRSSRLPSALGALIAAVVCLALAAPVDGVGAAPAAERSAQRITGCLRSVPEPGSAEPVRICYTLFKPARASARRPVPLVMHSHGWGGSRWTERSEAADLLAAGYGVLSFDQRGFGDSGGKAHVENPSFEGEDVVRLVRLVSRLPWVLQDGPGDPRLGAIGGSYGGGYQFLGAFELLRRTGEPVFDALAPEITWNDLRTSIAPEGVVRTEWAAALTAGALPSQALPESIYLALVQGAATGEWPDGSIPVGANVERFFRRNGPVWHVQQGRRLDIPVLFGQGTTDTLFPFREGLRNWRTALTPGARKRSIFVAYNGGHTLPSVLPAGVNITSDPCSRKLGSRDFRALSIRFLDRALRGLDRGLRGYGRLHLATAGRGCVTVDSPDATRAVRVGRVSTPTVAGAPVSVELARGPITVSGAPYLTGRVTTRGLRARAFYGLAVGTSPLTARLVQNNVLPLNEPTLVAGRARRVDLPAVSVRVPDGESLYLLTTPVSDTFAGMGSRTPGLITIRDTVVHLPVVEE